MPLEYNAEVTFKLTGLHLVKLNAYCKATGLSRSEVLREAVAWVVDEPAEAQHV